MNIEDKMPETERRFQKRQIAHKVGIGDILNCDFVKDEFSAGHIKLGNFNVSRINIIAAIVYKSEQGAYASAVVDDGTGKILLRSFESADIFSKLEIGDIVLMVGRIREFNNERYIVPEILKKIDNALWMAARKLELKNGGYCREADKENARAADKSAEIFNDSALSDDVYSLIKNLDSGDGVFVDDVVKKFNGAEAENMINKLLKNGNIFEISPGKLKVLE